LLAYYCSQYFHNPCINGRISNLISTFISDSNDLSLPFFLVYLAKSSSIWLIFTKNQLLVLFLSILFLFSITLLLAWVYFFLLCSLSCKTVLLIRELSCFLSLIVAFAVSYCLGMLCFHFHLSHKISSFPCYLLFNPFIV
jgi:hypothetical protein